MKYTIYKCCDVDDIASNLILCDYAYLFLYNIIYTGQKGGFVFCLKKIIIVTFDMTKNMIFFCS